MDLYSVFVTGTTSGIGLEFVRQLSRLAKPPRFIFATYRSSEKLGALKEIINASKECKVELIKMDVQNEDDVAAARKIVEQIVGENGLTLLINNAGFAIPQEFPNVTEENMVTHFTVNTVGAVRVFQEMLPLLKKSAAHNASLGGRSASRAAVLNISSMTGSITRTGVEFTMDLRFPGYKASKAALNMAMRVFAANIKEQGVLVVNMCPGWVKTEKIGDIADIFPEESISAMLNTLEKLNDSHHGSFIDRFGNPYAF